MWRLVFQYGGTTVIESDAVGPDKQGRAGRETDITGTLFPDVAAVVLPMRLQRNAFIAKRTVAERVSDGSDVTIQSYGGGTDQQYHALVKMHQRHRAALRQVARFVSSDNHVCHARQYTREP